MPGDGYWACVGAALVICANLLLRPLVRAINRQPTDASEVATNYSIALACHAVDGARLRAALLSALAALPDVDILEVTEEPGDDGGHVNIAATLAAHKPRGIAIESVVFGLARQPGVVRSQWRSTTSSV